MAAKKKPEGVLDDIIKAAAKAAAKKANPRNSYTLGKKVIHGSPVKNLKKINPTKGSKDLPNETVTWSFNPKSKGSIFSVESAKQYAGEKGSLYIGKVPRSSLKKVDSTTKTLSKAKRKEPIVVSNKAIKVKKEIKLDGKNTNQVIKEVNKNLKKSGGKGLQGKKYSKQPKTRSTDF
jgi:hypothetical protein